ncbi:MAG TPA: cohesin domain-containing protein [Candidatus Saccharimonadales bacterium]|nr:cohesin domain-containing protein [Candidatus Saccharimonadales bacterium]
MRVLPTRTLLLILALIIAVVLLLYIAWPKQPSPSKVSQVVPTPTVSPAHTVVSISPDTFQIPYSTVVSAAASLATVNVSTGTNKMTGLQLELQYDPKVLSGVVLSPGTFFPHSNVILNKTDPTTGRITYMIAVPLGTDGVSGDGAVATIQFKVIGKVGDITTLAILPQTIVTAQGVSPTVLKAATGANITITSSQTSTSSAFPTTIQTAPTTTPLQ